MGLERQSALDNFQNRSKSGSGIRPGRCPSCGGELRYPGVLDACIACGYSRASGRRSEPVAAETTPQKATKVNQASALREALREVPPWAWVMAGGCVAVLAVCTLAAVRLTSDGLDRALFTTITLGMSLLGVIVAEVWVFPMIALEAHHLGVSDFVVPFRFWKFAFQNLPRTCRPVCLLSWGVTAMLGSLFIVGGLWYWLPGKPKTKFQLSTTVVKVQRGDSGPSTEEAIKTKEEVKEVKAQPSTDDADDEDKRAEDAGKPTKFRCAILGYTVDDSGKLEGLVLGVEEKKGQFRYAGVVRRGINAANEAAIRQRLAPHIRLKSTLPDFQAPAIWVEPRLYCEVTQSGIGSAAVLPNPFFRGLLADPKEKKK